MFKIKKYFKTCFNHSIILLIFILFSCTKEGNSPNNYFFTLYPSHNNKTSYIIHSITPYSKHLTFDLSQEDYSKMMKSDSISDYANDISSIITYRKDYLIKTCFGLNKIVEIIPINEAEKAEEEINIKYIYSDPSLQISQNLKYCYSTIVSNPSTSKAKDENIIITYWVQTQSDGTFLHRAIFFYPAKKKFSKIYNLKSNILFPLNKRYPIHCTTFRTSDIFCSYYDLELNNQYVIETNKILKDKTNTPSVHFVLSDFGQIKGKNMLPISLNKQIKSIFGGYYDIFLAEFSEKKESDNKKNNTVILYSFYRKSLHASLVPMFSVLELFFGINIRDDYIETNMFNYLLEGNEMMFIFIYNNMLQAIRVDYSKKFNIFKKYEDFRELGYYSAKLKNCKNPKFMQSTYVNTTIKYTDEEKTIVNGLQRKYLIEKDIASIISCEDDQGKINYVPNIIELPQCLIDLDELNNHEIHKINFYLSIGAIVYSIYDDIRLKSFRNVGILFYPIEKNYEGLIEVYIKLRSKDGYVKPVENYIYYDITDIRFQRLKMKYVPYFTKQFHLKYRLYKVESKEGTINRISSSVCYFQIKFFPWDNFKPNTPQINPIIYPTFPSPLSSDTKPNNPQSSEEIIQKTDYIIHEEELEPDDICNIPECSLCAKTEIKTNYNGFICEKCDASELEVMIPDTNLKSPTYGACICNTTLGFKKDPIINTCYCQDDYAYYKTTNLCWPLSILENGPYYTDQIDDITEIPIYDDCYKTCERCSQSGNDTNHNCDVCKEGFVRIDDDMSNCYNESELNEGYHQVEKDKYIKCHDNCISCTQKPEGDKQYCTECRSNVSYYLRENPHDEYFNCFSQKCDLNTPSLLFAYDINSHECLKNCENGVKPYTNNKICLNKCNNEFPFLDLDEKLCYDNCEKNPKNKLTNYDKLLCTNEAATEPECNGERKYKNKNNECIPIPEKCLTIDAQSELCTICNLNYYPLKSEMHLPYFNCYKTLEEIILEKNKSNYYLNETEKYWDECYPSCATCYGYGSENRQRCLKCKEHYYLSNFFLNNYNYYNNCLLELTPNENCTSTQIDMYKYHDFCAKCKPGYAYVNGFEKCFLEKELIEGAYYPTFMEKMTGDNRDLLLIFKVYFTCYKFCKSCSAKGDFYDNNCTSCIEGYLFDTNSKFQNCINPLDLIVQSTNINNNNNDDYEEEEEENENEYEKEKEDDKKKDTNIINTNIINTDLININITEENLIQDSYFNTWFSLGNNSFYIYQQGKCYLVFYHSNLILVSSRQLCNAICPIWNITQCPLKKYERFRNVTKEEYNTLISKAYDYSTLKKDINILISEDIDKIYFQITNNVSPPPKNISYIDLKEYSSIIKSEFGKNLLLVKADIKRSDTQSTQVEYQFFNPDNFVEKINLEKNILLHKRRLNTDNENNNAGKVNIDLPVTWTKEQLNNINYLSEQNINAFNSSSEFYTDNCYQFTSSKGGDVFLDERKKEYYPDIPLCEEGCTFVKYNTDTEKVTCKCGYKINSENYTSVVFKKNEKDEKFKKEIMMENIQSMKCVNVIFKWTNLKSNPGFIIMIIFLIIFIVSCILYYIFNGFKFLDSFLRKAVNDKGIIEVLKSSVNLDDNDDGEGEGKGEGKNEEDDKSSKGSKGSKENMNKKNKNRKCVTFNFENNKPKNLNTSNISDIKDDGDDDGSGGGKDNTNNNPTNKKKNKNKKNKLNNSFVKMPGGYDTDSQNSSVLKNDPNQKQKPENKNPDNNNDKKSNNPDDNNNNKPIVHIIDEDINKDEDDNNNQNNNGDNNEEKKKKKRQKRDKDKFSEGPGKGDYENDSMHEYLKNDPNFGKNKQNNNNTNNSGLINDTNSNNSNNSNINNNNNSQADNENENDINNNIPKKEEEENNNEDINNKEEKEENPNEDNKETEIKINKKRKNKKKEKSMISEGQKPEDYSKDNSTLSGVLKGKIDDKISDISNEKKSEKEKSLISENSKQKKSDLNNDENEEEISMGNISKINHLLADESKNDEEILNEIDNKDKNDNNTNKNNGQENNPDINLNINDEINKKEEKEENKETNEIKLDDIKSEESLDISKENNKEKKDDKIIDIKKKKTDSSYISKFSQVKKAKEEGFYDNDSNIFKDNDSSQISKDIYDLISEDSNHKANPPKSKKDLSDNEQKENEIIESIPKKISVISVQNSKMNMKSSNEQIKKPNEDLDEIKEEKEENKESKKANVNNILNTNEEIMPFSEFVDNHKNFTSIYLADLKKHHIIYFSFCYSKNDINNIYLKLSLFSISIILYFSLNTIFMINSKMANVYFDFGSSSPIYVLINLILPYIICGIIILLLKRYILYNHYVTKIIKTIQENKELRRIVGIDKVQEQIIKYKDIPKKNKKHIIKNVRNKGVETLDVKIQNEYQNQKDIIQSKLLPLYPKYKKIVAIYFLVGFIFLAINWYMMTSFCAIYKNTGVKLIVNSFVSLLASFIFPCILGLIPSLVGFLSKKLNNRILYKIYKTINKVI